MRGLGTIFDSVLMLLHGFETLHPSLELRVYPCWLVQVEAGSLRRTDVPLSEAGKGMNGGEANMNSHAQARTHTGTQAPAHTHTLCLFSGSYFSDSFQPLSKAVLSNSNRPVSVLWWL